ncbi:hypothetical protein HPB50_003868 [Hyalomma asiaticum]|uniref:Uncharacterized protein n=1 Tax=Hyalomma asiaticum TaxID=266040 RepID=A0ACB7TET2_HYAAI|nr:hypothetical protein HPB50_003868 [Hyalomma asiaticum]
MLCGDVELNPGPSSSEQILSELLKGQREIKTRLDEFESRFKKFEYSTSAIADVCSIARNLERKVVSLELKLAELEDRSRRNSLLVFGVKEKADETREDLEESVLKNVFSEALGVHAGSVERIHRIGRKRTDKVRPVIVKFYDHREKVNILKNSFKLKNKGTQENTNDGVCVYLNQDIREFREQYEMLVTGDFNVHIEELGSRTNTNGPTLSLAPSFCQVLQDRVSDAIQSPRVAPPVPAPLSYAEVAAPPPQPTFSPPPFDVP